MPSVYRFHRPSSESDYDKLYDVMNLAFKGEGVDSIVRRFIENHPEMSDENYFMVMHGKEAVAALVLIPQRWVIDGVELKVAEMGCVGTVPEYRNKGLQRILNDEFDTYALEHGYDLCVLAGIPYFYRQFGYQYAVELDYASEIDVDKLPRGKALKARPFSETDKQAAQEFLERSQEKYLVRSIRTESIWQMQMETGTYGAEPFKALLITSGDEPVAYYRWWTEEKALIIRELAMKSDSYAEEVASLIRSEAEKQGLEKIKTKLSHEDAFSKYLIEKGAKINKPYGWQVKIMNPEGFLRKLAPAMEKRIAGSEFKGLTKTLKMNFWKYAYEVSFEEGKLVNITKITEAGRILGMNPYASIQLFLGYRSRKDLEYAYPDFYVRDGLDELIDVLFPRKPGYIHYCY